MHGCFPAWPKWMDNVFFVFHPTTGKQFIFQRRILMGYLDRFKLDGKVAIVTGSSRGIGNATA